MSYSNPNPIPQSNITSPNSNEGEQKLKLYQAFIFSIPICFTFIVLFVLYVLYLRRNNSNIDWSSLGMRGDSFIPTTTNNLSMVELGLSKELREMLPIVIFKESSSVNESQCSVCLGDYQTDEKLQQMPTCGHTFHIECIDLWLTSHTTCPLCRLSLITKQSHQSSELVTSIETSNEEDSSQQESHSTSEAVSQTYDGQEGDRDSIVVSEETQESNQNCIGTSNGCCRCRLG